MNSERLPAEPPGDDHEETVVVDRNGSVDEATVVIDRGEGDRTIVVERSPSDEDEATVVVDRAGPVDDATVVVDRDATVAVGRSSSGRSQPDADATVVSGRGARAKTPPARGLRGRQRINLPPVEPGFAERATLASGPGAVESYSPRELPDQPLHVSPIQNDSITARPSADSVPSVRKSSRRFGVAAVAGFAAACVVSVIGLSVIVVLLLRGF